MLKCSLQITSSQLLIRLLMKQLSIGTEPEMNSTADHSLLGHPTELSDMVLFIILNPLRLTLLILQAWSLLFPEVLLKPKDSYCPPSSVKTQFSSLNLKLFIVWLRKMSLMNIMSSQLEKLRSYKKDLTLPLFHTDSSLDKPNWQPIWQS